MTRGEFGLIIKAIKAVYADPKLLADDYARDVWYEMLKDLPYKAAGEALKQHFASSKYPPTIADIRQRAAASVDNGIMSPLEAWAAVYKAICNSSYNSQDEFDKLPPLCKQAVGRPENLKEWASMDTAAVESVEQSHFIRIYTQLAAKATERLSYTPPKTAIEGHDKPLLE